MLRPDGPTSGAFFTWQLMAFSWRVSPTGVKYTWSWFRSQCHFLSRPQRDFKLELNVERVDAVMRWSILVTTTSFLGSNLVQYNRRMYRHFISRPSSLGYRARLCTPNLKISWSRLWFNLWNKLRFYVQYCWCRSYLNLDKIVKELRVKKFVA